jgi:hypothetical protein
VPFTRPKNGILFSSRAVIPVTTNLLCLNNHWRGSRQCVGLFGGAERTMDRGQFR